MMKTNKKGLIVVNGYYHSAAYAYQVSRFREELEKKDITVIVSENNRAVSTQTAFEADFALFLDKDYTLATLMEQKGIRVFNTAQAIENADSKARTAALLAGTDIKIQKTVFRPKRYVYDHADKTFLRETAQLLGFPLVAKFACGSLGEQVFLIENEQEMFAIDQRMGVNDGIYQQFRATSKGESNRVIVIGGKAIGACKLSSKDDFRSNAHNGGKGSFVTLPDSFYEAAENAANALGLCYCGVDLFCDEPVVIEVNGNAFFDEFEKKTGINVAKKYIEYIVENVYD